MRAARRAGGAEPRRRLASPRPVLVLLHDTRASAGDRPVCGHAHECGSLAACRTVTSLTSLRTRVAATVTPLSASPRCEPSAATSTRRDARCARCARRCATCYAVLRAAEWQATCHAHGPPTHALQAPGRAAAMLRASQKPRTAQRSRITASPGTICWWCGGLTWQRQRRIGRSHRSGIAPASQLDPAVQREHSESAIGHSS